MVAKQRLHHTSLPPLPLTMDAYITYLLAVPPNQLHHIYSLSLRPICGGAKVHGTAKCRPCPASSASSSSSSSLSPSTKGNMKTHMTWHCECSVPPSKINFHLALLFAVEIKRHRMHLVTDTGKAGEKMWNDFGKSVAGNSYHRCLPKSSVVLCYKCQCV